MTLDKHTLLHVYFCCSPHQTWVQFCNTSRQGRCRQAGRCVTSDTKVQQQHWGAHYSVANMSTTSRHICTLLAIETKTQSHSQVWMCDRFAVRVWSRPSNALSRSVPAGYWGKMAGYQLFRPCLLVIWVNGWSSAGSKGSLLTTHLWLSARVQNSSDRYMGYLLKKWSGY